MISTADTFSKMRHFALLVTAILAFYPQHLSAQNAGFALDFDGQDDSIIISDSPLLSGGTGKSITVEAWVNIDTLSVDRPVIQKWLDKSWKEWSLLIDGDNQNAVEVAIEYNGNNFEYVAGGNVIQAGQWYHIAMTYDWVSKTVRIFINGVEYGTGAVAVDGMPDTNAPVLIGRHQYVTTRHYMGELDEVRIWNYAKTASELQASMNLALAGTELGLIAYYNFDEGSGTTIHDLSGNGLDGQFEQSAAQGAGWTVSTAPLNSGAFITVTSPNGGESLKQGSTHTIVWTSGGAGSLVNIEYSINGGSNWNSVLASTLNDGLHSWVVPVVTSTDVLVRVTDAANSSLADVSDAAFSIIVPPPPGLNFFDITLSAGTGGPTASGQTGGHAAIFSDVDGDGLTDLYHTMLFKSDMSDLFFHNTGNNVFADEGVARGINDFDGGSHGSTFSDLDNDGDFDLFNGTTGSDTLPESNNVYRNDGTGFFTDVTSQAGLLGRQEPTRGVLAFDMDRDGDLDLLAITNYLGTNDPPGERNEFYRNDGGLKFTAIESGPLYTAPAGQGATDIDYDGDGDIDIFAGNRTGDLNIIQNDGLGNFTLISPASIGITHQGREGATFGDVNNDGHLDVLLSDYNDTANFAMEHLYVNNGNGTFTFHSTFSQTDGYMGAFGDFDNDGDLDIVFSGDQIVYINDGSGNFSVGPAVPVTGIDDPRGIGLADIDNDGDLDFAIGAKRSRNYLIRNDLSGSGNWLKIKLISPFGQAGAFGAKLKVYPFGQLGGQLLAFREARSNNGYLGQNEPVMHVGLGGNTSVDVEVIFLDGRKVTQTGVPVNQTITIDASGLQPLTPIVNSFTPGSGLAGTLVTVSGTNFTNAIDVAFNGLSVPSFTVISDSEIQVQAPVGVTSGPVRVATNKGSGTSSTFFAITGQPLVNSFTPAGGGAGTSVSISGVGFTGSTAVKFNGVQATAFTVITDQLLTADVPVGAATGSISVTNNLGIGSSVNDFVVSDLPGILSFSPLSGEVGIEVTIAGYNFNNATSVIFNGLTAPSFTIDSNTQIRVNVPAGATSGKISVVNSFGTGITASDFDVIIPTSSFSFNPIEDGQVKLTDNGANYGSKSTTKVEQNKFSTYYKFSVTGLAGSVQSATLRLKVSDGASDGGDSGGAIYLVSNNFAATAIPWVESTLTSGNSPLASGSPLQTIGSVAPNAIVDFDVTAAVNGDATYSFCILGVSGNTVKYYTKEGSTVPELIVVTGSGSGNQSPLAVDDNATTVPGNSVVITVTSNDSDPDGTIDPTSVAIASGPANGTASVNVNNGVVTYTPNSGFSGSDSFTYTVKDNLGAASNVATVTITITGSGGGGQTLGFSSTQDAQVKLTEPGSNYGSKSTMKLESGKFASYIKFAVSGLTGPVQNAIVRLRVGTGSSDGGDSGGSIYLVSNDFDGTSTPWVESTLTSGNAPPSTGSALSNLGAVTSGEIVDFDVTSAVTGNGTISFRLTPSSGNQVKYYTKEGSTPPELLVTFGSGGGSNVPPVANDDSGTTGQGISLPITVTANDTDSDGSIDITTVSVVSAPANGVTTVNAVSGVITYAPNSGYSGVDTFTYTVKDDQGAVSNTATVTVTVSAGNLPPVAVDDNAGTSTGAAIPIDVLTNDTDADGSIDPTTVAIAANPANGAVGVNPFSGVVTYTPNTGFSGTDIFTYTVKDNAGASSNIATVTVTVAGSGGGQSLSFQPIHDGQVKITDGSSNYGSKSSMKVEAGKFASYLKFLVTGLSGTVQSAVVRLLVADGSSDGGDNGGSIFVTSNDFSGSNTPWVESTLTAGNAPDLSGSALSTLGAISPGETVEFDVTSAVTADGTFSFSIQPNSGNQIKYYTKEGSTPPELVVVTGGAGGQNVPPVAQNDSAATSDGISVVINVTQNDSDSDGTLVLSSVTAVTPPAQGTTFVNNATGAITYSPTNGFQGTDTFTYTIEDNLGAVSNVATVTVQVAGTNIPPVAVNDTVTTDEDVAITIDVTSNDSDPDGAINIGTVTITTPQTHGSAAVNASTGEITFTPEQDFFGSDSLKYTVQDDGGAVSNAALVLIAVDPVNDAPLAIADQGETDGATNVVLNVMQNDSDVDGTLNPATVNIINAPAQGSVGVNPFSGIVTYSPDSGFSGSDSFTYSVKDNDGATSNIATVTIDEAGGQTTTYTFSSVEDNQIKVIEPARNYGSKSTMKVEVGRYRSYLKFDVNGLTGAVQSATLRLYVVGSSDDGGSVYQVGNDYAGTNTPWLDEGLNAGNAPVINGVALGNLGIVTGGTIVDLDVTSAVNGNGTYSFALKSGSDNQAEFSTLNGSNPVPELVITAGGTPPPEQLTLTSPNGGEVWTVSNSQTVSWTSSGAINTVKVELSTDGGSNWNVLENATANDGSQSVPAGSNASSDCFVRISDAADGVPSDVSAASFTIAADLGTMDIVVNADDEYELYVNGALVGSDNQWNLAQSFSAPVVSGENVVAAKGINGGGVAGLILEVRVNGDLALRTDDSWRMTLNNESGWQTPGFNDSAWNAATDNGQYGVAPWNRNITNFPSGSTASWIWSSSNDDLTVYLRGSFFAGTPQISSFTPASGLVGSEITVHGQNFATTVGGASSQGTIRIMPLGNSITKGVTGSTDNAGYRNDLASLLDGAGIAYNFVGSDQNGSGFDNEHEGHNGYWADETLAEIDDFLNDNPPDMILFHIGTNDISSQQSNSSTINEIGQNLDHIRNFDSNIITILAGIIPRKDSKNSTTTNLVNSIKNLVTQRQQAGERVYYAPINETFKDHSNWQNDYFPSTDNIHPNDTGYGVMAGVWFDVIQSILSGGATTVAFDGVQATRVTVDSNTQLRTNVPSGATSGKIMVSNNYGSAQSANDFTVLSSTVAALEFSNLRKAPSWEAGSTHSLQWKTLGEIEHVKLECSVDDGATWAVLSERTPNKGRFVWRAPSQKTGRYRFRISDADKQSTHSVNEGEAFVQKVQTLPAIPNVFELRDALFATETTTRENMLRSDLNGDGVVNLIDYVNLLDLGNADLERLKSTVQTGIDAEAAGQLTVTLPPVQATAGSRVRIPVEISGDQLIRGFQFTIRYDSSMIDLSKIVPYENMFGMRLEAHKDANSITVIGYLEKQNSAKAINGTLVELDGHVPAGFDGYADVQITDVLFVSRNRLSIATSDVKNEALDAAIPSEFALLQNYPNPFNPKTQINYHLPAKSKVSIHVYNLKGELVTTLLNKEMKPGRHKIAWDGRNTRGSRVASGVYVYRIRAGKWKDSKMMTLLK